MHWRTLGAVILVLLFTLMPVGMTGWADTPQPVVIYYNRACGDCLEYVDGTIVSALKNAGYNDFVYKDYVNEPANRQELLRRSETLQIPPHFQSHLTIFVGETLILEGHIPEHVITDLLQNTHRYQRIVVYQDKMSGATEYTIWGFRGEPQTYPLDAPVTQYLDFLGQQEEHDTSLAPPAQRQPLLLLVLTSGFLDGLNPCAFAVLLFFIAFLFTLRRSMKSIWAMGLTYITAIYAAYFLIGLGLMRAVLFANDHHFMAKVGSWLVILMGLINVKDYFFPQLPIHLRISTISHRWIKSWLQKATLPAAAVGGFLVGLCTFPCSGGIYVAVVSLLGARTTFWQGFAYLGLYNLMFVSPLLIMLVGIGNRRVLHQIRLVEQSSRPWVRLATGVSMIIIGAVILLFFV